MYCSKVALKDLETRKQKYASIVDCVLYESYWLGIEQSWFWKFNSIFKNVRAVLVRLKQI